MHSPAAAQRTDSAPWLCRDRRPSPSGSGDVQNSGLPHATMPCSDVRQAVGIWNWQRHQRPRQQLDSQLCQRECALFINASRTRLTLAPSDQVEAYQTAYGNRILTIGYRARAGEKGNKKGNLNRRKRRQLRRGRWCWTRINHQRAAATPHSARVRACRVRSSPCTGTRNPPQGEP